MKKQKMMPASSRGFTLVELLLVMAIVGILAGTILVGVSGQREKARAGRALESMNSVLPYAVECYIKGTATNAPAIGGNNTLCGSILYPELGVECAYYPDNPSSGSLRAWCGGTAAVPTYTIECDVDGAGNCVLN